MVGSVLHGLYREAGWRGLDRTGVSDVVRWEIWSVGALLGFAQDPMRDLRFVWITDRSLGFATNFCFFIQNLSPGLDHMASRF